MMLMMAFAVKVTSRGPVFYRQERMGLDGKPFMMLKFRSMRIDQGGDTVILTPQHDPRVTGVGRFLRKTSMDELPQFWNVLKGEMSIVGPRPERSWVVEEVRKRIPLYMLKHKMKAGITGWAQVNGWRGDTSLEKRIEHDLYYIEHWSLWFDFKIMFLTLWRGFIHKHAY
jgi:exopolysaccharide biosynthesis polyprenyl glycosylphosphotransferase